MTLIARHRGVRGIDSPPELGYIPKMRFDWDDRKATANREKHGITFEQAITAFDDRFALVASDPAHSLPTEDRRWLIGASDVGVLVVVFTIREPGAVHRIISAWRANRRERKRYEQSKGISI